jgi:hypothetical protein
MKLNSLTIILCSIFVMGFIVASPPNPMAFYGDINYTGTIPEGYYITAKIDNSVHGQCLIIEDKYGYGQNDCVVVSDINNVQINFYIGNSLIGSSTFNNLDIINFNFTLETLPPRPEPLSNGVCEPNFGECSFNFLDCHVSSTDLCSGNNRCDVEVGETCSTTSGDCGQCPSEQTSSSGGTGGGGSSGGGGGSPSITNNNIITISTNNTDDEDNVNELLDGNENSENKNKKGITGAVIGALGTGGSILLLLVIILGILAGIYFGLKKNKGKNKKK